MEKLIADKQHGKHVYPVLEMLNNKVNSGALRLKLQKCKFENLIKKILK